jgi:hypothetical protein
MSYANPSPTTRERAIISRALQAKGVRQLTQEEWELVKKYVGWLQDCLTILEQRGR